MHINLVKTDFEYIEKFLNKLPFVYNYENFILSEFTNKIDDNEKKRIAIINSILKSDEHLYRYNIDDFYELTEKGTQVLNYGVEKYFIEKSEEGKQRRQAIAQQSKPPILVTGNAIIGNNNAGNSFGQGFDLVAPIPMPIDKPAPNDNKAINKYGTTNVQFIVWLFTAFASGIGIGYMLFNTLKNCP